VTVRSEVVDLPVGESLKGDASILTVTIVIQIVDRLMKHVVFAQVQLIKKGTREVRNGEVTQVDEHEGQFEVLD